VCALVGVLIKCLYEMHGATINTFLPHYGTILVFVHSVYSPTVHTCHYSVNTVSYTKINNRTILYHSTTYCVSEGIETSTGETVSRWSTPVVMNRFLGHSKIRHYPLRPQNVERQ